MQATATAFAQVLFAIKSRPHQQQCRSNIVEHYKSNDSFDKVERCFDVFGNNVEQMTPF